MSWLKTGYVFTSHLSAAHFNNIPYALLTLYINYQLDAQIIIYSYTISFLYMFRAINAIYIYIYICIYWCPRRKGQYSVRL